MVVVGMRPARRIDLAGRNANRAQCRNRKSGFLTASPDSGIHAGQRRQGAGIAGLIGHMLVAPVVNFQDGLFHGHTCHTLLQFLEKDRPGHVQRFIVNAQWQHKVVEQQVRHLISPRHLLAGIECRPHILQVELDRVVRDVGQRHVGIQEAQRFHLLLIHVQALHVGRSQLVDSRRLTDSSQSECHQ